MHANNALASILASIHGCGPCARVPLAGRLREVGADPPGCEGHPCCGGVQPRVGRCGANVRAVAGVGANALVLHPVRRSPAPMPPPQRYRRLYQRRVAPAPALACQAWAMTHPSRHRSRRAVLCVPGLGRKTRGLGSYKTFCGPERRGKTEEKLKRELVELRGQWEQMQRQISAKRKLIVIMP